ncbi:ABC transporter substrate-binding protein [Paracoccus sp. CPCC 101403]|uniref:ABC transporter substrate-binding protein n=1 Tax=Paracoccus broussonetiae TaxID=3075834 RepID=A0ABU3E9I1_9RHOB|nr:ABC transporter substrate-binding protein [Paracoccus sp. CPCC 101403]MDT1060882.1 ABC transporter substrate-binding protein [Paracoccus sp. CPCC 101403]
MPRALLLAAFAVLAQPALAKEITLHHAFGETRVDPDKVKRIVSVGYHEQDFLYALGIAPVGVHDWFGEHPFATGPWAEEARQAVGATPDVQKGFEIDVEWAWGMEPDLILATYAPMDPQTYAQLSEIAPVVGPPAEFPLWGAPWDAELRLIAQATGREAKAEEVIDRIGAKIGAAVAAHPQFRGLSGTAAYFNNGQIVGYRSLDGANRLLTSFGVQTPPEFDKLVGDTDRFQVSPERFDLFDLDVILWLVEAPTRQAIEALPAWRNTRAAREGRAIWASPDMMGAMAFQSPLSIEWALEPLTRLLAAASDGDPATPAEQTP